MSLFREASWWEERVSKTKSSPLVAKRESSKSAAVAVLALSRFAVEFLNHLLEPFVPILQKTQNLDSIATTALEGSFGAGLLFGTLIVPYMIGHLGSKRVMLFSSLLMLVATGFALVFAQYFQLLVARLMQGFAGGVVLVSSFDLLAKLFLGREPKGFMLSSAILAAASSLGTSTGLLSCLLVDETAPDLHSLRVPFLVAGFLTIVLVIGRYLLHTPFDAPYATDDTEDTIREMESIFVGKLTFPLLGSVFLVWAVIMAWSATIPIWFSTSFHSSLYVQALHVAAMFFCVCIGNILAGLLMEIDVVRPSTLWIVGYSAMLPAIFFMMIKIETFDNIALGIGGLAMGVFGGAMKCLLALSVEPQYYTVAYSACYLVQAIAAASATIGGTFITTEFGFVTLQACFAVTVLLFLPWVSAASQDMQTLDSSPRRAAAQEHTESAKRSE